MNGDVSLFQPGLWKRIPFLNRSVHKGYKGFPTMGNSLKVTANLPLFRKNGDKKHPAVHAGGV